MDVSDDFRRTNAAEPGGDVRPEREELQETGNRGNATLRQSDARPLGDFSAGLRHARGHETQMEGNNGNAITI